MAYSQSVEQWRPLVAKYFKPEDVDKALYVINGESGGNAGAVGDGGASIGLFQLNDNGLGSGLDRAARADPETNIKTAAAAVYGGSGWKPWGEGSTFNGKTFGALGNNPYGGTSMTTSSTSASPSLADVMTSLPPPDPKDFPDAFEYQAAVLTWAQTLAQLGSAQRALNPGEDVDPAQQAFDNKIKSMTAAIGQGNLDLSASAQAINRWLNGQQEARARAELVQTGQDRLQKYGVPAGKTSLSYSDLGRGLFAEKMGIDPNSPSYKILGTQYIDPEADLARFDTALGVNGAIPSPLLAPTGSTAGGMGSAPQWTGAETAPESMPWQSGLAAQPAVSDMQVPASWLTDVPLGGAAQRNSADNPIWAMLPGGPNPAAFAQPAGSGTAAAGINRAQQATDFLSRIFGGGLDFGLR